MVTRVTYIGGPLDGFQEVIDSPSREKSCILLREQGATWWRKREEEPTWAPPYPSREPVWITHRYHLQGIPTGDRVPHAIYVYHSASD